MTHVLVIGASKGIGLETTQQALEAGHCVRAFARSADGINLSSMPIRLTQTPTRYRTPHRMEASAPASNFWFRTD